MACVKLGRWILDYVCKSPHRDGNTRMCVCLCVLRCGVLLFPASFWENLDLRIG